MKNLFFYKSQFKKNLLWSQFLTCIYVLHIYETRILSAFQWYASHFHISYSSWVIVKNMQEEIFKNFTKIQQSYRFKGAPRRWETSIKNESSDHYPSISIEFNCMNLHDFNSHALENFQKNFQNFSFSWFFSYFFR